MSIARLAGICLFLAISGPSNAADPPPFPDFTFKMGKPPAAGAGKRITVQIEPDTRSQAAAQPDTLPDVDIGTERYGWFWQLVSPSIDENAADRLRIALDSLTKAPGGGAVASPRLQSVQSIAQTEGAHILRSTIGTKVSPALVLAVIAVESGGDGDAVSGKGALGLMQLMPETAKRFGVTDSMSAGENIKGGVAYLDWLLTEFEGDAVMALAGYNAGENAVKKHKGVPPYAETRDYVPKVLAAFEVAKSLCKTRPELISDGCALHLASY